MPRYGAVTLVLQQYGDATISAHGLERVHHLQYGYPYCVQSCVYCIELCAAVSKVKKDERSRQEKSLARTTVSRCSFCFLVQSR